ISHENNFSIIFTIEIDKNGTGNWRKLTTLKVSPFGYKHHQFNDKLSAEWIRLTANRSGKYVTAYFHYGNGGGVGHNSEMFQILASSDPGIRRSIGLVYPQGEDRGTLGFAAWNVDKSGAANEIGYYEMDESLKLRKEKNDEAYEKLKNKAEIGNTEFLVDDASVIVKDQNGRPYRLPKGSSNFDILTDFGQPRSRREVVTERDLLNAYGIFYCLPRPNSGGI